MDYDALLDWVAARIIEAEAARLIAETAGTQAMHAGRESAYRAVYAKMMGR